MSGENYLICSAVADNSEPVVGSIMLTCARCGCAIWVSPTGVNILAKEAPAPLCIACGKTVIEEEDAYLTPLNEEQVAELKDELRRR